MGRSKIRPFEIIPVINVWVSTKTYQTGVRPGVFLAMTNDLEPYENITRVFWIKIELKENPRAGRRNLGEIKDVISGAKLPIHALCDIIYFIIPYLEQMGIKISWYWRFGSWLERKRRNHSVVISSPNPEESKHRANP